MASNSVFRWGSFYSAESKNLKLLIFFRVYPQWSEAMNSPNKRRMGSGPLPQSFALNPEPLAFGYLTTFPMR